MISHDAIRVLRGLRTSHRGTVSLLALVFTVMVAARIGLMALLSAGSGTLGESDVFQLQLVDAGLLCIGLGVAVLTANLRFGRALDSVVDLAETADREAGEAAAAARQRSVEPDLVVRLAQELDRVTQVISSRVSSSTDGAEVVDGIHRVARDARRLVDVVQPSVPGYAIIVDEFRLRELLSRAEQTAERAGNVAVQIAARDDVPDVLRGDGPKLLRTLALLIEVACHETRCRTLQINVSSVGVGCALTLEFELRDAAGSSLSAGDRISGSRAADSGTTLGLRAVGAMARGLGGSLDVAVRADGSPRYLLRAPVRFRPADAAKASTPRSGVAGIEHEWFVDGVGEGGVWDSDFAPTGSSSPESSRVTPAASESVDPPPQSPDELDWRAELQGFDIEDDAVTIPMERVKDPLPGQPAWRQASPSKVVPTLPEPRVARVIRPTVTVSAESYLAGADAAAAKGGLATVPSGATTPGPKQPEAPLPAIDEFELEGAIDAWRVQDSQVVVAVAADGALDPETLFSPPAVFDIPRSREARRTTGSTPVVEEPSGPTVVHTTRAANVKIAVQDVPSERRVLVVDDDAMSRWSLTGQLSLYGYTVDAVASGRMALQAIGRRHYHVVLLDTQMPDMNGFELAARIRARDEGGQMPIVALSGAIGDAERARCRAVGVDELLRKPIDGELLAQVVDSLCDEAAEDAEDMLQTQPLLIDRDQGLDLEILERLERIQVASDQPDLVGRMVGSFLEKAEHAFEAFDLGFEERDPTLIRITADRLRRSCATIGVHRMEELSERLSSATAIGSARLDDARPLVESLFDEFQRVRPVLAGRV